MVRYSTSKFYPFREHFLFTFKLFARRFNPKAYRNINDCDWQAVQQFIEIRSRLMHPKSIADLEIYENEIKAINKAQTWLRKAFKSLFSEELNRRMKSSKMPREGET